MYDDYDPMSDDNAEATFGNIEDLEGPTGKDQPVPTITELAAIYGPLRVFGTKEFKPTKAPHLFVVRNEDKA